MDLYEYQARAIFEAYGVPVLEAFVVTTAQEARAAAERLGRYPVVIKAQVKIGGRGKAGGVKLAYDADQTEALAAEILGMDIRGHKVRTVMVTEGAQIEQEYYFSILLDRANRCQVALCSKRGGVDIEALARDEPDAVARVRLDPKRRIDRQVATEILRLAHFDAAEAEPLIPVLTKLGDVYWGEDATLVEVNPLVKLTDGNIIALDGKISLDDNAQFRHPNHAELADVSAEDPREVAAQEAGLNYVRLDGQVGVVGNGAGLVMSTLDVVEQAGRPYGVRPANFLDIGGGASAEVMAKGLEVVLGDAQVRSVFVNVFGGITACDAVAEGILGALALLGDSAAKPIVVRLDGNRVAEGREILRRAENPLVTMVATMDEAATVAAQLASEND